MLPPSPAEILHLGWDPRLIAYAQEVLMHAAPAEPPPPASFCLQPFALRRLLLDPIVLIQVLLLPLLRLALIVLGC